MTLLEPSLFVRRLAVLAQDHVGYDERFHNGLNLITGETNSVGKSTIINMLVYALGADLTEWTPEALRFDHVLVEVELNGAEMTLRRQISTQPRRPMDVFWGQLDAARNADAKAWERYPYARSENRESFSSLLFKLLRMPEIQTDLSSKITMHQLLRLIFVDQLTPFDRMFRFEQFDSGTVRREVGAILCGYYSDREYQLRDLIQKTSDELRELRSRQRVLEDFILDADQNASVLSVQTQLAAARDKLIQAEKTVREALQNPKSRKAIGAEYRRQLREAQRSTELAAREVSAMEREVLSLQFAEEDSREFIASLDKTLAALDESESIRDALGEVPLRSCPACYNPIVPPSDEAVCALCKEARPPGSDKTQLLRMRRELELQREESLRLQVERDRSLRRLQTQLPNAVAKLKDARHRYAVLQESIDPAFDATIGTAYRDAGYLQGVVEDLERQLRIVEEFEAMRDRGTNLANDLERFQAELLEAEEETVERRATARQLIKSHMISLLHQDERDEHGIAIEQDFANASEVDFSFEGNKIWVGGRHTFSASSMVILKNVFHLAVHLASLENDQFRYPRLLIMDNIEDKGMRPSRSHNFQRLLREVSASANYPHQIIASTSMIADELRQSEYVVGRYYTPDRKTLVLKGGEDLDFAEGESRETTD